MIHTKEQTWQEISQHVSQHTDALGMPIDTGIRETVIALNALGIPTLASCEGHLDHGQAAPWVEVGDPEAKPLARSAMLMRQDSSRSREEVELLQLQTKRLHFVVRRKLLSLLDLFYAEHTASASQRLIVNPAEWSGVSRLESQGVGMQCVAQPEEQARNLAQYQDEMQAFTAFLKRWFYDVHDE